MAKAPAREAKKTAANGGRATKAKAPPAAATGANRVEAPVVTPPWERKGRELRFEGHRVMISGKLATLRKEKVVDMLTAEGATIEDALGKGSTLFLYAVPDSANHKRAQKMEQGGANLLVVTEDDFRRRFILPTVEQACEMLLDTNGRKRLERLLELNRERYSRSTDAYSEIQIEKRSFEGANLSNASLCGLFFIECDLRNATLANTEWLAEARNTDFRGATASKLEIWTARDCDFRGCELASVRLCFLEGCRFEEAKLSKAVLCDASTCCFDGATLEDFGTSSSHVKSCSFENVSAQRAQIGQSTFEDCSFVGADFQGATVKGDSRLVVFTRCDLRDADFRGATLCRVKLESCNLTGARFDGATLIDLELVDTDATKASGLDTTRTPKGPAHQTLEAAAPTFKNIEVGVMLRVGSETQECKLYQFNHGTENVDRQAWLDGDNLGAFWIADAIAAVAKLRPGAKVDEDSLVVKVSKGTRDPALPPKAFEKAILDAWQEALP